MHHKEFSILTVSKCVQFGSAKTIHVAVKQVSRTFLSCNADTLYLLNNSSFLLHPRHLATTVLLSVNLTALDNSCQWNLQYLSFWDWLISRSTMLSCFFHAVARDMVSFLFKAEFRRMNIAHTY